MVRAHPDSTLGNRHAPHNWEYADAAARTGAAGLVAGDVRKVALQLDNNSLWLLTDDSPVTWVQLTGAGSGAYTNEEAQDAVGGILTDSASINFTYTDATPEITAVAIFGTGAGTVAEGNHTHAGGYTDEQAQDAVGAMLADTSSINLTYTDATPELKADAIFGTTAGTVAEGDHAHAAVVTGLTVNLGDGVNVITSSEPPVYVKVPFAATVTAWELIADVSGSITVLVHRAPTATPTTWTEISGSSDPALSSADNNKDTTISGDWSDVTLDANDWLRFTVTGTPASVKRVGLSLTMTRTV